MKAWIILFFLAIASIAEAQNHIHLGDNLKKDQVVVEKTKVVQDSIETLSNPELKPNTSEISQILSNSPLFVDERFENPHPTRYFFGPSAIPIKKGEKYYQNALFLLNSFQIGITDNFSIGAGTLIPFAVFITPKVGYHISKNLHLGGGLIVVNSLIKESNFGIGAGYGSATLGSKEHNLTLNVGLGAYKDLNDMKWKTADKPMVTLSGMTRISDHLMLMSENWFVSANTVENDNLGNRIVETKILRLLSLGIRYLGNQNAFDVGFIAPSAGGIFAFPYLSYNRKF